MTPSLQRDALAPFQPSPPLKCSVRQQRQPAEGLLWARGEPVRVVGGRIPDFLGGAATRAAEWILAWPADPGSLRDAIAAAAAGVLQEPLLAALQSVGILDAQHRLLAAGINLSYHLQEYRCQAGRDGALGMLREEFGLDDESRLLEVGCGAGQTLLLLGPAERVGLDIDLESLALGWQLAREASQAIDFVRGSATALPLRDGYFSHVFSRITLNYVHQWTALAEQVRVLRPGGFLYCRAEGPGYDLSRLRWERRPRALASFAYDFLLGLGLAATGLQAAPGAFPSAGRAFATRQRLTRFLQRLGCTVLRTQVSGRCAGVPSAIDVLARKAAA